MIGRAALVGVLAGVGSASVEGGAVTLPFAVAVLALGLLYGYGRGFVALCAAIAVGVAVASARAADLDVSSVAVAGFVSVVVILLGLAQHRAALPDPPASVRVEWPEPRLDRGASLALATWTVACAAVALLIVAVAGIGAVERTAERIVRDAYSGYVDACEPDGALESQEQLCADMREQRASVLDLVDDHAPSVLALLAALLAVGGAGTSHLIVIARARRVAAREPGVPQRPAHRLRALELHWAYSYVGIAGFAALAVGLRVGSGTWSESLVAVGAGLAAVALLVMLAQGAGFFAWRATRRPVPMWYRVVLVLLVLFALPVVLGALVVAGMFDSWLRPRRRTPVAT